MVEDWAERWFLRPIVNASYPATLSTLSLAVIQVTRTTGILRAVLGSGALMFTVCAFAFFFYSIYPTRRYLRTATAISFIMGLGFTLLSVLYLLLLT